MVEPFNCKIHLVGVNWKNTKSDLTSRPQGNRVWQVNLFHAPVHVGADQEHAQALDAPAVCFFAPKAPQWYCAPEHGFTDDWFTCDGDIDAALSYYGLKANVAIPINNIGELERVFKDLHREWQDRDLFAVDAQNALVLQIMRLCVRGRIKESTEQLHFNAIMQLRKTIREHIHKQWSVADMAQEIGLSENRFSILYKRYCGEAPLRDLTAFRMQRALELLTTQDALTIADIAELCGFQDAMYFSRVFKRYYGRAPSAYRKV